MGGPALVIWCRAVVVSECFLGHWVSAVHLRVDSSGDGWKSCWGCWGPWGQGRLVTGPRSWWRNRQSVVQPWWEAGDSGRNCSLAPVWVCLAVNWEWNQLRQASYYLTSSSFDYLKKVTQCWIENLRYLEALTQRSPFSFLCWASAGQLSPTKVGVAKELCTFFGDGGHNSHDRIKGWRANKDSGIPCSRVSPCGTAGTLVLILVVPTG